MRPTEQVAVAVDNLENVVRGLITYQRAPLEGKIAILKRISYPEPQPIETIAGQVADTAPDGMQDLIELAAGQAEQARISLHSKHLRDMTISVLRARLDKLEVQMSPVRRLRTLTAAATEQATKMVIDRAASSGAGQNYATASLARHLKAGLDEARRIAAGISGADDAVSELLGAIDALEQAAHEEGI